MMADQIPEDWDEPKPAGIIDEVEAIPEEWVGGEELACDLPEETYFVKELGLVSGSGAPHIVAGYGFSGKTMALQSLVLSLVAGRGVWECLSYRQSRAVHVDFEQGRRLTQRRYKRLAKGMGVSLAALERNIRLITMPPISLRKEFRDKWKSIMTGMDLLVIDSFRAATGGLDENSSEAREPLDMLGSISEETGCRAIVIHHNRKTVEGQASGAQSLRGSGAIFDACDCVLVLSAAKGEPIKLECVKARSHGEQCEDSAIVISDVPNGDDPKWGLRVSVLGVEAIQDAQDAKDKVALATRARRGAERVREILKARGRMGVTELRRAAQVNQGSVFFEVEQILGADFVKERVGHTVECYLRSALGK